MRGKRNRNQKSDSPLTSHVTFYTRAYWGKTSHPIANDGLIRYLSRLNISRLLGRRRDKLNESGRQIYIQEQTMTFPDVEEGTFHGSGFLVKYLNFSPRCQMCDNNNNR